MLININRLIKVIGSSWKQFLAKNKLSELIKCLWVTIWTLFGPKKCLATYSFYFEYSGLLSHEKKGKNKKLHS